MLENRNVLMAFIGLCAIGFVLCIFFAGNVVYKMIMGPSDKEYIEEKKIQQQEKEDLNFNVQPDVIKSLNSYVTNLENLINLDDGGNSLFEAMDTEYKNEYFKDKNKYKEFVTRIHNPKKARAYLRMKEFGVYGVDKLTTYICSVEIIPTDKSEILKNDKGETFNNTIFVSFIEKSPNDYTIAFNNYIGSKTMKIVNSDSTDIEISVEKAYFFYDKTILKAYISNKTDKQIKIINTYSDKAIHGSYNDSISYGLNNLPVIFQINNIVYQRTIAPYKFEVNMKYTDAMNKFVFENVLVNDKVRKVELIFK